jgi:hypothetical protein
VEQRGNDSAHVLYVLMMAEKKEPAATLSNIVVGHVFSFLPPGLRKWLSKAHYAAAKDEGMSLQHVLSGSYNTLLESRRFHLGTNVHRLMERLVIAKNTRTFLLIKHFGYEYQHGPGSPLTFESCWLMCCALRHGCFDVFESEFADRSASTHRLSDVWACVDCFDQLSFEHVAAILRIREAHHKRYSFHWTRDMGVDAYTLLPQAIRRRQWKTARLLWSHCADHVTNSSTLYSKFCNYVNEFARGSAERAWCVARVPELLEDTAEDEPL